MHKSISGLSCQALSNVAAGRSRLAFAAFLIVILFAWPASAGPDAEEEIECLALTIYFEARGEPTVGKIAVGHVVMNRVADPNFPKTICDVVRQGGDLIRYNCQFTWWCDGLSDEPSSPGSWDRCHRIARLVYYGHTADPTDGALWYHADYVTPSWAELLSRGPSIGRHVFYGRTDTPPEDRRATDDLLFATSGPQ
jgi:spore germination cell wall hydrolase CwlJ-like protein